MKLSVDLESVCRLREMGGIMDPQPVRIGLLCEEAGAEELLARALGGAAIESHCCSDVCCGDHELRQLTSATLEDGKIFFPRLVNHLKTQYENKRTRFGPDNRHTTRAQKQEIFQKEGWCCATPGCCCTVWLQIHYIKPYSEGGKTVKENLLALCSAATATSIKACSRSLPNPTAP